jgi:hypothetical protein
MFYIDAHGHEQHAPLFAQQQAPMVAQQVPPADQQQVPGLNEIVPPVNQQHTPQVNPLVQQLIAEQFQQQPMQDQQQVPQHVATTPLPLNHTGWGSLHTPTFQTPTRGLIPPSTIGAMNQLNVTQQSNILANPLGFGVQPLISIPSRDIDRMVRIAEIQRPFLNDLTPTKVLQFRLRYAAYTEYCNTTNTHLPSIIQSTDSEILNYVHFKYGVSDDRTLSTFLDSIITYIQPKADLVDHFRPAQWKRLSPSSHLAELANFWISLLRQITLGNYLAELEKKSFKAKFFEMVLQKLPPSLSALVKNSISSSFNGQPSLRELHLCIETQAIMLDNFNRAGLTSTLSSLQSNDKPFGVHKKPRYMNKVFQHEPQKNFKTPEATKGLRPQPKVAMTTNKAHQAGDQEEYSWTHMRNDETTQSQLTPSESTDEADLEPNVEDPRAADELIALVAKPKCFCCGQDHHILTCSTFKLLQ